MTKEELSKRLGCIQSEEDTRDALFALPPIKKAPQEEFSLKKSFRAARDQEDVPACTAFAAGAALEALKGILHYVSPRDLYCRRINHSSGMPLRNACSLLKKEGVVVELCLPFVPNAPAFCVRKPCSNAKIQRSNHRIASYHRLSTSFIPNLIWQEQKPVLAAIPVYENWDEVGSDGMIPQPQSSAYIGLHAVVITGWKHVKGLPYFEFRNSWGIDWGNKGYGFLPPKYHIVEAWMMKTENDVNAVEVLNWSINNKSSIFGLSVLFSIRSSLSCSATLFVNSKKRGVKKIRKGISKLVFNIPFFANSSETIRIEFADFRTTFGIWHGTLITTAVISDSSCEEKEQRKEEE